MVDLIHERFATYYHADKMSTTFVFCFMLYIIMVITPFLISFTAGCTSSSLTNRVLDKGRILLWATHHHTNGSIRDGCANHRRILLLHQHPRHPTPTPHFKSNTNSLHHFTIRGSQKFRSTNPTEFHHQREPTIEGRWGQIRVDTDSLSLHADTNCKTTNAKSSRDFLKYTGRANIGNSNRDFRFPINAPSIFWVSSILFKIRSTYRNTYDYPPYYDAQGALLLDPI